MDYITFNYNTTLHYMVMKASRFFIYIYTIQNLSVDGIKTATTAIATTTNKQQNAHFF